MVDEDKRDPAREAKVKQQIEMVQADRKHWQYAFDRMEKWRKFARGLQWPGIDYKNLSDADRRYVANVTMRHLKQRTAAIYAKNPTFQWRRSKRMTTKYWDGTVAQIQAAMTSLESPESQMILQDAMTSIEDHKLLKKQGETMRILYEHFIREQIPPTKKMMKKQVLTSLTCGVAYFKQTFHRVTEKTPEVQQGLQDATAQLAKLERLLAEAEEGDIGVDDADMETLNQLITELESKPEIVLREGLTLNYPDSTKIIPDKDMTYLPGFVGCGHVTEEYDMTPDRIRETYDVDLGDDFTEYNHSGEARKDDNDCTYARVWEIWDKTDNLVYTVCDGYHDYLREPHEPFTYTERFWPWFVYAPNAVDCPDDPFPPSDVELMQTQQAEINRAGESLRQHRHAARPRWVTGSDIPDGDRAQIANAEAHSISALKGLQPDEDVRKKFQAFPAAPLDPNLYSTGPAFDDVMRSVGSQEANLGGTSGATATETSIAESTRQSTLTSSIDEFDDLLTEMGRAGGQILLQEMSVEQVEEIVGRGAVWPEQTREQVAKEIHLEVVAGSSGRPNQAQQVAVMERVFPLLYQLPGMSHEKLARHAVQVLDDGANFDDWMDHSAVAIQTLMGQMQAAANGGPPATEGGANAPATPEAQPGGQSRAGQSGFGSEEPPADVS